MTRQAQQDHWKKLVEEQQASGGSARAFCREQGVSVARFYQWRKRFDQEGGDCAVAAPAAFIELVRGKVAPSGVRLRVGSDGLIDVIVDRDFDSRTLQKAVLSLREIESCSL